MANKEYAKAFDCAHTLKGVAGNLGLVPMFNIICKIVEPLRANDYSNVDKLLGDIMCEKEKLKHIK